MSSTNPEVRDDNDPGDPPLKDAGYRALQAERERARQLEAETKRLTERQSQLHSELTSKYEIDLEAMRVVSEREREQLQSQYEAQINELKKLAAERDSEYNRLQSAVVSKKITDDFTSAIASEMVNPQMANLLMREFADAGGLDHDGNTMVQVEDKLYPLGALKQHCQEVYPELFKPPAIQQGIGLNQFMNGTPPAPRTKGYVSAKDQQGFLNNLDAIAKGEVRVIE